ncbi:MAG TPA: MFS transporter [Caulobacteraceae bacterium]|jgi:MFS family permease|nr:MFS transporter [Caulobacteraceae bacterium]
MSESQFAAIDEQKFHRFHVRALLVTGLGVFCDGYDISAIGLVLPQALAAYGIHKVGAEGGVLSASALVGSMLGAVVFGILAQKGRKRFYGVDALILGVAALAQAFMPSLIWLIACRFVLGIGVGADYVLSPTIMAEHANRADRGKAIGLGFGTMWPIGALAAAVLKLLLDSFHVPPDLVWKIVLAAGALPALGVMYFRRRMPESARFLAKLAADKAQAMAVMQEVGATQTAAPDADSRPFGQVFALHARHIFAAALLWMMYDLAVYSSILFGPNLIAANLHIPASIFTIENELIFVIPASVLGSWLMIDQWGRKPLQVWGFVAGAVVLALFAVLRSQFANLALLAFLVFGLFNIALTGPGLVSGAGIFGVELAPTRIRSVAQSITVVGGRIGAAMSGFVFPVVQEHIGFVDTMWGLAALSLLGGVLSQLLVPETSSRSLEEINPEHAPLAKAAA